MADAQQPPQDEDLIISFFPDPPPFYRKFTAENLERLKEIEKEAGLDSSDAKATPKLSLDQILALPAELRYLIPPEPPADDQEFNVFGTATTVKGDDVFAKHMEFTRHRMMEEGVLEDWTYEQLYPAAQLSASDSSTTTSAMLDRQKVLFRLLRSILLAYMSLLGLVAIDPVSPAKSEKIAEMLTMVMNMHALINEYRPHQARETLIRKMEAQVLRKKAEIESVRKMGERVRAVLDGFEKEADKLGKAVDIENGNTEETAPLSQEDRAKNEAHRHAWETMDEMLGP